MPAAMLANRKGIIPNRHWLPETLNTYQRVNCRCIDSVQIERAKSIRIRRAECVTNAVSCDRMSEEAEPATTSKKSGIVRSHQQSCINRTVKETKTAGTLAVVVGGFVACWLPFFILYLATPFVPMNPPDVLMTALTWLGIYTFRFNAFKRCRARNR